MRGLIFHNNNGFAKKACFTLVFIIVMAFCYGQQMLNKEILPNIWSGGQIFAYSALDGPTVFAEPYTCFTLGDRFGLRLANKEPYINAIQDVELQKRRPFWFSIRTGDSVYQYLPASGKPAFDAVQFSAVTSSYINVLLGARGISTNIKLAFANRSTIAGTVNIVQTNNDTLSTIELCCNHKGNFQVEKNSLIVCDSLSKTVFKFYEDVEIKDNKIIIPVKKFLHKELHFTVSLLYSGATVAGNEIKISDIIKQRTEPYSQCKVPDQIKKNQEVFRTYLKAVSILRGNVESPVSPIGYMWTTPDRSPHECMWEWDSGFHGLGWLYFDKQMAQNCIKSVLSVQKENGFIPHMICPYWQSQITMSPVLSWCTWEIYKSCGDKEFLKNTYPGLKKFITWIQTNRDENKNGLYEWNHADESGMDNSPRFDGVSKMDAVDLNCFIVNELEYLSLIASELGYKKDKIGFSKQRGALCKRLNTLLWCPEEKFYFDKTIAGNFIKTKAVSGFLPLFAGVADRGKEVEMIKQLTDSTEWMTPFPFPSVSLKEKSYNLNMWRGSTWINYSYFIYKGLKRYNHNEIAKEVAKRVINQVSNFYNDEGSVFEFYDPRCKKSPRSLPRKNNTGAINEYGWSAALFICFVNEEYPYSAKH